VCAAGLSVNAEYSIRDTSVRNCKRGIITESSGLSMDLDWGHMPIPATSLHLWDQLVSAVVLGAARPRQTPRLRRVCTTATVIDTDCDGLWRKFPSLGPDADDSDPAVNTAASMIRPKYIPSNRDPFAALRHSCRCGGATTPPALRFHSPKRRGPTCAGEHINLPCATFAKAQRFLPLRAMRWCGAPEILLHQPAQRKERPPRAIP